MKASFKTAAKRRAGRRIVLGGLLVLSVLCAYAFKTIFARPGEASLQYVPDSALLVASIDLSPSPQQALTFEKIEHALDGAGVHDVDKTLTSMLPLGPTGELVKSYVQRNGSLALL